MAADQPQRLHAEGDEGRKVDQPEQAQKQEGDKIISRRDVVRAPQEYADAIKGYAVRGDEDISPFRDGRKPGQFSIEREPDSLAARLAQGQEAGLGGARMASVGPDVLHCLLKIDEWDRRILRRHFLIRFVVYPIARELFPVAGPVSAEPAIAVIDQSRLLTGDWRVGGISGLISKCLLHDFDLHPRIRRK